MNYEELRLECLKRTVESYPRTDGHTTPSKEVVVERARAYADFVLGTNDGEVIAAARVSSSLPDSVIQSIWKQGQAVSEIRDVIFAYFGVKKSEGQ